jgi:hypothetical protein
MTPGETGETPLADAAPPGALRKFTRVIAALLFIAAMLFAGTVLLLIEDQCALAGHRWSGLYTLMVLSVPGPIIIKVVEMLLVALTPLTLGKTRPWTAWAFVLCALMYGFIVLAGVRTGTWLGGREEPRGPAFCQMLRN